MHPPLPEIIHKALLADRREPTGLLHCSSHSHWPLRFTQLSQVFPTDETDFGALMTMKLGTLTHDWLEQAIPEYLGDDWGLVASEYDITSRLPLGWTGTIDYVFQHVPSKTYVIADLKTIKPESVAYLDPIRPKHEHTAQVSCYHVGFNRFLDQTKNDGLDNGWTLDPEISVIYLPKGKDSRQQTVMPVIKTAPAEPSAWANMVGIKRQVDEYVDEFKRTGDPLNKYLAPMPPPELRVFWNKTTGVWDVKSLPSWQETYIGSAWDETLCPRTPSAKIGHYTLDGFWIPRKGYHTDQPIPKPSDEEVSRRRG